MGFVIRQTSRADQGPLVSALEALGCEERACLALSAMLRAFPAPVVAAWWRLAAAQHRYDQHLPAIPQPCPVRTPLAPEGTPDPTRAGGVVLIIAGSYAPYIKVESPHLLFDERGNVKAKSYRWLQKVASSELLRRGLLRYVEQSSTVLGMPLLGGVAHTLVDAYPGVIPVDKPGGGRIDAGKVRRSGASNPRLACSAPRA